MAHEGGCNTWPRRARALRNRAKACKNETVALTLFVPPLSHRAKEAQRRHTAKAIPTVFKAAAGGNVVGDSAGTPGPAGGGGGDGGRQSEAGAAGAKDPDGRYAAGAAGAAAERRFGMTADEVVEVAEEEGVDGGSMVVALRDAAGVVWLVFVLHSSR